MIADLGYIITFWFFISLLGWIYLPLTGKIFSRFFDKGYLFSKVIGIALSAYPVWLLASLKILSFSQLSIWLSVAIGVLVNGFLIKIWHFPGRPTPETTVKNESVFTTKDLRIFIFEEIAFFVTMAFWSYVRGFQPDIQGLEKFMDYGFINSILRSQFFPPADIWFAGSPINYYYFGHYVTAYLTKLSGLSSAITYNLMLGSLFAFCFSLAFSLTANLINFWKSHFSHLTSKSSLPPHPSHLKLAIFGGLVSALLISLGANLHPAYYNLKMGVFKKPYCDGATTYWYPNATRYIGYCPEVEDKTIHEFPSYSFVVSDLHGHVSDIPFVLTFLAFTFNLLLFIKENQSAKLKLFDLRFTIYALPLSLLLAIFFMTNQWDYPIYLMVLGFTLLYAFYPTGESFRSDSSAAPKIKLFKNSFIGQMLTLSSSNKFTYTLFRAVPLGLVILLASIPLLILFQLNFSNITQGIGLVRAHSLFYQLLILWGAPWFFGLSLIWLLFFRRGNKTKDGPVINKENIISWLALRLGVDITLSKKESEKPMTDHRPLITISDVFVFILFLVSTILVIMPEIVYVKDIYIPSYHRANTMFKLTYQSFMMFSVSIGYVFVRVLSSLNKSFCRKLLFIVYSLLFIALMVYPFYSIKGYYGALKKENYKGVYGLNFINRLYPDDYQAIIWLNQNVSNQPNILEAAGDSYTDYERISMATGLPTIEGWLVHEWLWRGGYDQPGARAAEVQTIYDTPDPLVAREILDKYQVKYVIVGNLEKQKYPNLNESKFNQLGHQVFTSTTTTMYQVD